MSFTINFLREIFGKTITPDSSFSGCFRVKNSGQTPESLFHLVLTSPILRCQESVYTMSLHPDGDVEFRYSVTTDSRPGHYIYSYPAPEVDPPHFREDLLTFLAKVELPTDILGIIANYLAVPVYYYSPVEPEKYIRMYIPCLKLSLGIEREKQMYSILDFRDYLPNFHEETHVIEGTNLVSPGTHTYIYRAVLGTYSTDLLEYIRVSEQLAAEIRELRTKQRKNEKKLMEFTKQLKNERLNY